MRTTKNIIIPPPLPTKVGPRMRGRNKHIEQLFYIGENQKHLTEVEFDFFARAMKQRRFSQSDKETLQMIALEVYERIIHAAPVP